MFFICSVQPPSFLRNASARRVCGDLSKPDSVSSQQRAARALLQPEFHQRRRLLRIIGSWIDRIRVPGEREQPLRLHLLHHGLPFHMLVARPGDLSARHLARHERTLQLHPKPLAELPIIRQRPPHPLDRRFEFDPFLNTVVPSLRNLQVADYPKPLQTGNPFVAFSQAPRFHLPARAASPAASAAATAGSGDPHRRA